MNKKYRKFVDEVDFSRQLLGAGLTCLRKTSCFNKGLYFQALSSISLGLERLMKLCLILDDYNKNNSYPSSKTLKGYGHDLIRLFGLVTDKASEKPNLHEVHYKAMELLSNFAKTSRYSNIDFIIDNNDDDPIKLWSNEVDKRIYEDILTNRKKKAFERKCEKNGFFDRIMDSHSLVIGYCDENEKSVDSFSEMNFLLRKHELLAGYRVLIVIQIIEYIYNTFYSMLHEARDPEFHQLELGRFFATIIYGNDRDKINRKDFIRM